MTDHRVVWSSYAYEGRLIKVRVDAIEIDGSEPRQREIVEHPGAVGVLPVLPDGRLVLVRQHRPAVGKRLLEVPAGTREAGESAEACARRELAEETGYRARQIAELVRFFVSPGWCNEELICFVATDLEAGQPDVEEDEQIEVVPVAPGDVPALIRSGEIGDSKTIISLLAYLGVAFVPKSDDTTV
jgi:ADP-ribose pyrophosphatase